MEASILWKSKTLFVYKLARFSHAFCTNHAFIHTHTEVFTQASLHDAGSMADKHYMLAEVEKEAAYEYLCRLEEAKR